MAGYNAQMRNGTPVFGIEPHMGLLRGQYIAGTGHDGNPFMKYACWYPDGRFSRAKETQHDLVAEPDQPGISIDLWAKRREMETRAVEDDENFNIEDLF